MGTTSVVICGCDLARVVIHRTPGGVDVRALARVKPDHARHVEALAAAVDVVGDLCLVALAEHTAHDQPQADGGREQTPRGKHAPYLQASYNRHGLWCESHGAGRESRRAAFAAVLLASATASANGRPPMTNGVFFKPGDTRAIYVATTFGLLVSPDGCTFDWLCEDSIGFGGTYDPAYAITPTGAILATTFHGVTVSRDGGCTFVPATAQLPVDDPNNISNLFIDAVEVSSTGEICVGSSDASATNAVWCSTDDAVTFAKRGALPPAMWFRSLRYASSDPARLYVAAYLVSTGPSAPTAHLFRSDDDGADWIEEPLAGVAVASAPQLAIAAVDPVDPDVVYLVSQGAMPPSGDRLYRSDDGAATFSEVLASPSPIAAVVVRDAQHVVVATPADTSFASSDGGKTYQPLVNAPRLGCLGQRSDGLIFGCGANYAPDHFALASTTDLESWQRVLRFDSITASLECASGTIQQDTCSATLWRGLVQQLGIVPSTCAAGTDPVYDTPPDDGSASAPRPPHARGCCDAGLPVDGLWLPLLCTLRAIARARRRAHLGG